MALRSLNIVGTRSSVYFRWQEGVTTLLRAKDGEVGRDVQRRAYAVQKRMKRAAPRRRGTLRRGIVVESVRESDIGPYSKVVSTAEHTMVQEYGRKALTSKFGPGYTMKFQPFLGMKSIFRYEVGPAKGTHFMERSVDAALD